MLPLAELVATSAAVSSTSARSGKVAALAALLVRCDPVEAPIAACLLAGAPRQGRIGVGWAALAGAGSEPKPAAPPLTVLDVDRAFSELAATTGPGSAGVRAALLARLLGTATPGEQHLVRRLLSGELHQGAAEGLLLDALAAAGGIPAAAVRRALMVSGRLEATAAAALAGLGAWPAAERSPTRALAALDALVLAVGTPVRPMLASPADDVAAAVAETTAGGPASVEYKLDGARIQVHRDGRDIAVFTRTLHDVTARVPEIVSAVAALDVRSVILDGETLLLAEDGHPRTFQDTMARFGTAADPDPDPDPDADPDHVADPDVVPDTGAQPVTAGAARVLRPWFFDCLHLDGVHLLDRPLADRRAALAATVGDLLMPALATEDAAAALAFYGHALAGRHEGVVVKDLASPYAAGRRGRAWLKVKPVHTLDLVVTAAEWGHGRRTGTLSNLHLGARDPGGGPPVMVGKTFKGLTDALLAWQTRELTARAIADDGRVCRVRPELVVEIELDGVQVSRRYPGGVALRFARVLRYRPDKDPAAADTIDVVRALFAPSGRAGLGPDP